MSYAMGDVLEVGYLMENLSSEQVQLKITKVESTDIGDRVEASASYFGVFLGTAVLKPSIGEAGALWEWEG